MSLANCHENEFSNKNHIFTNIFTNFAGLDVEGLLGGGGLVLECARLREVRQESTFLFF